MVAAENAVQLVVGAHYASRGGESFDRFFKSRQVDLAQRPFIDQAVGGHPVRFPGCCQQNASADAPTPTLWMTLNPAGRPSPPPGKGLPRSIRNPAAQGVALDVAPGPRTMDTPACSTSSPIAAPISRSSSLSHEQAGGKQGESRWQALSGWDPGVEALPTMLRIP